MRVVFSRALSPEQSLILGHGGNRVIFSNGMEMDYLAFNAGAVARIEVAGRWARLVVAAGEKNA